MKVNLVYEKHKVPNLPKLNEYIEVTNYYITYKHNLIYNGIIPVVKTKHNTWRVMNSDGTIRETQALKTIYQIARSIAYQEIEHIEEIFNL